MRSFILPALVSVSPSPSSTMALRVSFLLLFSVLLLYGDTSITADLAPSPILSVTGGGDCKDTLVAASPCLPYISSPPNNVSVLAPPQCCDAYAKVLFAGKAFCFCYLLKEPPLLGFPIDGSRLLSLASLCPLPNATSSENSTPLELVCSVLPALSPLLDGAGNGPSDLPIVDAEAPSPSLISAPYTSPSSVIITPEAADSPPYVPSEFDLAYPETSSASKLRISFSGIENFICTLQLMKKEFIRWQSLMAA